MTIKITNERQYIEDGDFCIYFDGQYIYQDGFGYKSYKTLNGLNKKLAKDAKMRGIDPVTVVE